MSAARPQLKFMLLSGMLLCPTASLSDSLLPSQDQPTFFNVRICRDRQVLSVLKAAAGRQTKESRVAPTSPVPQSAPEASARAHRGGIRVARWRNKRTGSCHITDRTLCCVLSHGIEFGKTLMAKKRKKHNLAGLDFQGLMDLRSQVDEALTGYRSTLERQLAALGSSVASLGGKVARGMRASKLKGMKVAPKYRGPDGDTWAGRGATPRWLKAAIKEGKKLEDFLIDKATPTKRATKRRKKK